MHAQFYRLYRGDLLLGNVIQSDLDSFPWYAGTFEPASGFQQVEHLFAEELLLLNADRMDEWVALWERIEAPGLTLVPLEGGEAIPDVIIHIEATRVRWRR